MCLAICSLKLLKLYTNTNIPHFASRTRFNTAVDPSDGLQSLLQPTSVVTDLAVAVACQAYALVHRMGLLV